MRLLVTVVLWAQPALAADSTHRFLLMTINDDAEAADGKLTLSLESAAGRKRIAAAYRKGSPVRGGKM